MTEKEKMLAGLLYNANDERLVKERKQAKELCYDFNACRPSETIKQADIIRKLFGKTVGNFEIVAPFWCDYGYNIEIGANFFANHNVVILDCAKVTFGDNVFIAPNCGFYTAGHPLDVKSRNNGLEYAKPIKVKDNVWIGAGVSVLPGVTVGEGATIGAGSVVVKDVPANTLVVGNPARVVRVIDDN